MKTFLKVAIHPVGVNPVFGSGVTHVSVEDDAGGGYIILTQHNELIEGQHAFNLEELEEVYLAPSQ